MGKLKRPIRILMAKPGLDGHDQGILVACMALKDAGMEVIYLGLRQTPEQIVQAAIAEDVDIIGMSSLSEAHMEAAANVMKLLKEKNATHIKVVVGGIYHKEDLPELEKMGVKGFGVDTQLHTIPDSIRKIAGR